MTLKTRWFGKKVKGETLKNLISALGEDPTPLLQTRAERWSTRDAHGRVGFTPTKDGVNVDLYVFRKDFHINESSVPMITFDYSADSQFPVSFTNSDKKETQFYDHHIEGEIKYQINGSKIKQGTSTGKGVSI